MLFSVIQLWIWTPIWRWACRIFIPWFVYSLSLRREVGEPSYAIFWSPHSVRGAVYNEYGYWTPKFLLLVRSMNTERSGIYLWSIWATNLRRAVSTYHTSLSEARNSRCTWEAYLQFLSHYRRIFRKYLNLTYILYSCRMFTTQDGSPL